MKKTKDQLLDSTLRELGSNVGKLQKQNKELVELVHDALSCNPNYTDQVTAIMEKLEAIRGEG